MLQKVTAPTAARREEEFLMHQEGARSGTYTPDRCARARSHAGCRGLVGSW